MTGHRVGVDEVLERYPLESCNGSSCDATIRRVLTLAGKRMPLDPDPVPDAPVVIRRTPSGDVRAVVLAGHDYRDHDEPTWQPHVTTCPNSAESRRRRAITVPRCHGCTDPLDRQLAARAAERPTWAWLAHWHPCCAPAIAPRPAAAPEPAVTQQELTT